MPKMLSASEKQELLSLKQEDLSVPLITKLFGKTTSKQNGKFEVHPPKFNTQDKLILEAGEYINKQKVETTVGSFLFNKLMIEGLVEPAVENGYYNEVVTGKKFKALTDSISTCVMMGKIPVYPNLIKWLKHYEFYSMKLVTLFSPSYTEGLLRKNPSVEKEKERILKSKEINTVQDMSEIEDALVASSAKILDKDPGMTLFKSGARGSFDNDYKNINLMLGPTANPAKDGEFNFVKHSYLEGLQKEDIVAASNVVVSSAHPKAMKNVLVA